MRVSRFAGRVGQIGKPLPDPFPSFRPPADIKFRHGGVSMIAGAPGTSKSVLALNILAKWAKAGLTAVYFSADSDEFTVSKRLASILTSVPSQKVEADYIAGNVSRYVSALTALDQSEFYYKDLRIDGIEQHISAFEAVHGDYPDVIFIDNAINYIDNSSDWRQVADLINQLNTIGRETQSAVVCLHHTSESESITRPPPRHAVQGKVSQIPRVVLTVGYEDQTLYASCVKSTNGPQYPNADVWLQFRVNQALQVQDRWNQ